jgi:hypothetical protein
MHMTAQLVRRPGGTEGRRARLLGGAGVGQLARVDRVEPDLVDQAGHGPLGLIVVAGQQDCQPVRVAGRATRSRRCCQKLVLNALTTLTPWLWCWISSLVVAAPLAAADLAPR